MVSNTHHKRLSEVIADPDRTKKAQKAQKISRSNAKDTMPGNCRNPIKDTLADWRPMKGIPHEFTNMAEPGDTTNQSGSGSEYTIQRSQADIGEAKIRTNSQSHLPN